MQIYIQQSVAFGLQTAATFSLRAIGASPQGQEHPGSSALNRTSLYKRLNINPCLSRYYKYNGYYSRWHVLAVKLATNPNTLSYGTKASAKNIEDTNSDLLHYFRNINVSWYKVSNRASIANRNESLGCEA